MLKNMLHIFQKTLASKAFWMAILLCLAFTSLNASPAEAEYDCPGTQVLKERYQGDCFPCQIVNVLLSSFMRAAAKVYDVSKDAGNKLLLLGTFMWLAFWALRKMSSLTNVEPSSMTNELVIFFGKVIVAYCFINAGIGTLVSYAVNPILGAGAEFGTELLLETKGMELKAEPKSENAYTGPTEIVSKSVMNKILKLSESVSNEVAMNLVIGNALTCFSIKEGINWDFIIKIHIPDIWMWLVGAAIWCAGFMLVLSVCYYLIDIPFKIGFAIMALPIVIGLWPFKMTSGKLKAVVMVAVNAAGTFLFLALSASYAMRLISSSFSTVGGLTTDSGTVLQGTEALLFAIENDNVKYINNVFSITGASFLIIMFCYIYAIKMISHVTESYPSKFFGGSMTASAGSPLHHMATAATMWAANKAAAPFKMAGDIVANQAGKAATTVAKAGINVTAGAVSYGAGRAVKWAGKGISGVGRNAIGKAKENKEAWATLSEHDDLSKAGLGAKLGNKFGRMKAGLQMGLANTVAKAGEKMEIGGDMMTAPGQHTYNRMMNAGREGLSEINQSLGELAGQLPTGLGESIKGAAEFYNEQAENNDKLRGGTKAGSILNRTAGKVLNNIGSKIVNNQPQGIQASAQRDYLEAKEKFNQSARKLATYVPASVGEKVRGLGFYYSANAENSNNRINAFLSQKLGNALTNTGNTVLESRAGTDTIRHKLATMNKDKFKTVFSGKAIVSKVKSKYKDFKQELKVNHEADKKILKESAQTLKYNATHMRELNAERLEDVKLGMDGATQGFGENFGKKGFEKIKEDTKAAYNELRGYTDKDGNVIKGSAKDFGSALGDGLTAVPRHTYNNTKEVYDTMKGNEINNAFDVAAAAVRPAVATAYVLKRTGEDTLESAYQVAEKTMLAGVDVGLSLTAWAKTPGRAAVYGGYVVSDGIKMALTPVMTGVGTVFDAADTARKAVRMVTRPVMMTLGAVTVAPIGFAAKAVDETLYAGYKMTVRPAVEIGTTAVRGAKVLYKGTLAAAASTKAGRGVARTFRAGGKTLKVGINTLKLGRNMIRAAAGEGGYANRLLTPEEIAKNRAEKERRKREAQEKKERKRRAQEKKREEEERLAEEQLRQEQEAEALRQREAEEAERIRLRDEAIANRQQPIPEDDGNK